MIMQLSKIQAKNLYKFLLEQAKVGKLTKNVFLEMQRLNCSLSMFMHIIYWKTSKKNITMKNLT